MNATTRVFDDFDLFTRFANDPSYEKERSVVAIAGTSPKILGKIIYGLNYPQAMIWSREKRLAMKMATMYLTAKEYLIESGIPEELLDISAIMFGNLGGKPVVEKLRRSVRFICVAWHARTARVFHLLVDEFRRGKNVASYGCGSGIVELLALIASGNKAARLALIDVEVANISLAHDLANLLREHEHSIDAQITLENGDVRSHRLPAGTDTAISIGLLHNYFGLDEANHIMKKWFAAGATKAITDICYDPAFVAHIDARTRINFVHNVLDWDLGPPDGLLFCGTEEFCNSLSDTQITAYDHGLNATIVVSPVA